MQNNAEFRQCVVNYFRLSVAITLILTLFVPTSSNYLAGDLEISCSTFYTTFHLQFRSMDKEYLVSWIQRRNWRIRNILSLSPNLVRVKRKHLRKIKSLLARPVSPPPKISSSLVSCLFYALIFRYYVFRDVTNRSNETPKFDVFLNPEQIHRHGKCSLHLSTGQRRRGWRGRDVRLLRAIYSGALAWFCQCWTELSPWSTRLHHHTSDPRAQSLAAGRAARRPRWPFRHLAIYRNCRRRPIRRANR